MEVKLTEPEMMSMNSPNLSIKEVVTNREQ